MDLFPKVEDHFYDFDLIVIITLILDDWTDNLDEAINMTNEEGMKPIYKKLNDVLKNI